MPARRSGMTEVTLPPGVRSGRLEPLWDRVDRNRLRFVAFTVAYIVSVAGTFTLLVTLMGILLPLLSRDPVLVAAAFSHLGDIATVSFVLSATVVSVWVVTQLARSEPSLLKRLEAVQVPPKQLPEVRGVLREMSLAAGFEYPPPLYVIETDRVNAFVIGRDARRTRIGITRGFAERLSIADQRAVFANLFARVLSADTLWATAVSALAGPIWAIRDIGLRVQNRAHVPVDKQRDRPPVSPQVAQIAAPPLLGWIIWYGFVVIVTEVLSYWHQESAWNAAEKADAEGMLLLKDPHGMLRALENVLERNNHVPSASDAYSQLFFCWAGFGFAPENDPEWRRIYRLREVLGVEGLVMPPRPNVPDWPVAPRLEAVSADYLYESPVATPVSRGPGGVAVLSVATAASLVAYYAGMVLAGGVYSFVPGFQAFVLAGAVAVVGVTAASYLLTAQGPGGTRATSLAWVSFGAFVLGTLGAGVLLAPVWAIAAAAGRSRGESASRAEWRKSFVATLAEQGGVPSSLERARTAEGRRVVQCAACGASNAPVNRVCVVCGRRLKPR